MSLLTTDYKLIAKVLANRLKTVLGDLIDQDQSYLLHSRKNNILQYFYDQRYFRLF